MKPFGARPLRLRGTPVLLYHAVVDGPPPPPDRRYQMPLASFETHVGVVAASGRRVVSLSELWSGAAQERPSVALTFDDGHESDYRLVLPRLAERGWTADCFVNPGTVGQRGYVTWPQLRVMADAGIGVQSHGYDHLALWRLSGAALRRQLGDSRRRLEDATGRTVKFLAAPFGLLSPRVVAMALDEGYQAVVTSWNWPARPGRRKLGRVSVYPHTTPTVLARLLDGQVLPYAARLVRAGFLYPPKRVLLALQPDRLGATVTEQRG